MVVYVCINLINGKKYVGKTINFNKRVKEHLRCAKNNYLNYPIHRALNKYGSENFEWKILIECDTEEELNMREIEYIKLEKSKVEQHGYNVTDGGDGASGLKHTEEFKSKQSKKMMGNTYSVGRVLSDEHKAKISKAFKGTKRPECGRVYTEEQKKKQSELMMGRVFSETHRYNLANANKKRSDKNMYLFTNINGESFIGTPIEFKEKYNLDRSSITKLIKNKIKTTKGWKLIQIIYNTNNEII